MMTLERNCIFCGKHKEIKVNAADYTDWTNGKLIQKAMPYLRPADREMLISGICPDCWDKMFSPKEDE